MAAETQLPPGFAAGQVPHALAMARNTASHAQAAAGMPTQVPTREAWPAQTLQPGMDVPGLGQPGRPEPGIGPFHSAEILRRCVAVGLHPSQLRADAGRLLRGGGLRGPMGAEGLRRRFWTLQLALACVEDAADDEALALMLLPIEDVPGDREELARTFREALLSAKDEGLEAWLQEIASSPAGSPSAASVRATLLDVSLDPERLGARVRDLMRLPDQAMRGAASVEWKDQLREIEAMEAGTALLAELNSAAQALEDHSPSRFNGAYLALHQRCETFLDVIRLMAPLYALAEMPDAMERLKAALAADLAAAVPSRDRRQIQWILGRMSSMHLSSTLVEAVQQFLMPVAHEHSAND